MEQLQPSAEEIDALSRELLEMRKERGEKTPEMPDLTLEKKRLEDGNETLFESVKKAVKGAFDFLVVKPIKWIGNQIKEHPFRTALIALAAFAIWYYWYPLSAGLSGIKEEGIKIGSEVMEKSLDIDPTRINDFDRLVKIPKPTS